MADETETNWKAAYNALERQCKSASNRAGRDLAAFAVGSVVTSAAAYGFYRWRKSQHGCACESPDATGGGDGAGDSGSNGANGNENAGTNKATINPAGLPNQGNQGGMAPGDS